MDASADSSATLVTDTEMQQSPLPSAAGEGGTGPPAARGPLAAPLAAARQGAAAEGGAEPMDQTSASEHTPLATAAEGGGIGRVPADADDDWYSECVQSLTAALRSDELQGQSDDVRALWVRTLEGLVEVVVQ